MVIFPTVNYNIMVGISAIQSGISGLGEPWKIKRPTSNCTGTSKRVRKPEMGREKWISPPRNVRKVSKKGIRGGRGNI